MTLYRCMNWSLITGSSENAMLVIAFVNNETTKTYVKQNRFCLKGQNLERGCGVKLGVANS